MLNGLRVNGEGSVASEFLRALRGLENRTVARAYPRGSVLFVEGQPAAGVFILNEGRVKLSINSSDGKTLALKVAQAGEVLGMNGTFSGRHYSATAETLERCRIDFVAREDLLKVLDGDQRGYLAVAQTLSEKLSSLMENTRALFLSQTALEKLARLLIRWCDEKGKRTAQGIQIEHGLTHEEIAEMICTSRETVTRLFAALKRKHILRANNGHLIIKNRAALAALAKQKRDGFSARM